MKCLQRVKRLQVPVANAMDLRWWCLRTRVLDQEAVGYECHARIFNAGQAAVQSIAHPIYQQSDLARLTRHVSIVAERTP